MNTPVQTPDQTISFNCDIVFGINKELNQEIVSSVIRGIPEVLALGVDMMSALCRAELELRSVRVGSVREGSIKLDDVALSILIKEVTNIVKDVPFKKLLLVCITAVILYPAYVLDKLDERRFNMMEEVLKSLELATQTQVSYLINLLKQQEFSNEELTRLRGVANSLLEPGNSNTQYININIDNRTYTIYGSYHESIGVKKGEKAGKHIENEHPGELMLKPRKSKLFKSITTPDMIGRTVSRPDVLKSVLSKEIARTKTSRGIAMQSIRKTRIDSAEVLNQPQSSALSAVQARRS